MDSQSQISGQLSIILHLLGLNKCTIPKQQTKVFVIIDYFCLGIVCMGAGYLATMQGFHSLPINADSLAPFEEAQSLIRNPDTHLFNIHVSRIASIFPDLTINAFLQLIRPRAGFLEIFSLYAWCSSTLFFLLATLLVNEIGPKKHPLTADSIRISLITIILLNVSHEFNIIYAHLITPVHHGGNILNTLLLLTLAIRSIKTPEFKPIIFCMGIFTCLATLSNKISIFTAVLPSIVIYFTYLKGKQRQKYLLVLGIATLAGIIIGNQFNEQCATPEFNLSGTLSALRQYFQISWIPSISVILSIVSIFYTVKATKTLSNWPIPTRAGLLAVSISSLSYFLYLPMLTSSGEAPLRYICIAYALITVLILFYIKKAGSNKPPIILSLLIIGTLISFQTPDRPKINIANHQSLTQDLLDRSEHIDPFKNEAARFVHEMGYDNYLGLGDYWMSGATLSTNSKIYIVPIHYTGVPDFWGATPQDIKRKIKTLDKKKSYLLTENDTFKKQFEKNYGPAVTTWNYDEMNNQFTKEPVNTTHRLQVYDNPKIYNRVRKSAKKFKRQCDPSLPKYKVR